MSKEAFDVTSSSFSSKENQPDSKKSRVSSAVIRSSALTGTLALSISLGAGVSTEAKTSIIDASSVVAAEPIISAIEAKETCDPNQTKEWLEANSLAPIDTRIKMSKACFDLFEYGGDVALVNYAGLTEAQSTEFEADVEDILRTSTKGLISIDATFVEPTTKARSNYEASIDGTCVDADLLENVGAVTEPVMPELQPYDMVVSLVNEPACDADTGGLAYLNGHRYAEMYSVGSKLQEREQEFAETKADSSIDPEDLPFMRNIWLENATSHEILHLYAKGHHSELLQPSENKRSYGLPMNLPISSEPYNLRTMINASTFVDHASGELMGDGAVSLGHILPNEELAYLQWASVEAGETPLVETVTLEDEPITFDSTSDNIVVELPLPETLTKPESSGETSGDFNGRGFNTLTITPNAVFYERDKANHLIGVRFGLTNASGSDTLELGTVRVPFADSDDGVMTYNLETPAGTVELTTDAGKAVVKLVTK